MVKEVAHALINVGKKSELQLARGDGHVKILAMTKKLVWLVLVIIQTYPYTQGNIPGFHANTETRCNACVQINLLYFIKSTVIIFLIVLLGC